MNISIIFKETLNAVILQTDLWIHYYMCLINAKILTQTNYIKICNFVNSQIKSKTLNYGDFEDLEYLLLLIGDLEDCFTCMEKHTNEVLRYISCIVSNVKSLPTQIVGTLNITIPKDERMYSECIAKLRECKSIILFKDKTDEIKDTRTGASKYNKTKIE